MNLIKPMEPITSSNIMIDENMLHQVKWDGVRAITYIENDKVKIFTKRGRERTSFYPELSHLAKLINGSFTILDGEMIVLENERPSFSKMLVRERINNIKNIEKYCAYLPVKYVVFDILEFKGRDLRDYSLLERKSILTANLRQDHTIAITDDYPDGQKLFELMKKKGWEGIVSKRKSSKYVSGKNHQDWFKTKFKKQILAIICGIQLKNDFPNALILGVNRDNSLQYIGKASLGLKQNDLYELKKLITDKYDVNPFNTDKIFKNVHWIEPKITCIVQFMEWTEKSHLRHPVVMGFSTLNASKANGKVIIV